MRAVLISAILACSAALVGGCIPDERKELEWQKPPKAWDPKGDSLTLGAKGLEAFNRLSPEDRIGQVAQWIGTPGSFKGQAIHIRLAARSHQDLIAGDGLFLAMGVLDHQNLVRPFNGRPHCL